MQVQQTELTEMFLAPPPLPSFPARIKSAAFLSIATSLGAVFLAVPPSPQAEPHALPAGSRSRIFGFLEGRREGPRLQLRGDTPTLLLAAPRSSTHSAEENESKGYGLFLASVLGLWLPLLPAALKNGWELKTAARSLRVISSSARCKLCDLEKNDLPL